MAINNPGVRQHRFGGTVIQMAKRSEQLESIATSFEKLVANTPLRLSSQSNRIDESDLRRLQGYVEQLRIIADELKSVGK